MLEAQGSLKEGREGAERESRNGECKREAGERGGGKERRKTTRNEGRKKCRCGGSMEERGREKGRMEKSGETRSKGGMEEPGKWEG